MPGISFYILHGFFDGNTGFELFRTSYQETFNVGPISIKLTPAYHTWQNEYPGYMREFKVEDYCGFLMKTPDGLIWAPGDSRFLPEFLELPAPDVIFDFRMIHGI